MAHILSACLPLFKACDRSKTLSMPLPISTSITTSPNPRVVSLIASSTEMVFALGLEDLLVGRSHECDYPPQVKTLPQVTEFKFVADGRSYEIDQRIKAILQEGLSVYRVDAEKLEKLKPDIILTQTQCEVCAVSERDVREATCKIISSRPEIVSLHTNCLADLWRDIRKVAHALHEANRGEDLIRNLQSRIDNISGQAKNSFNRPRVACIEWVDPLMTAGNWMPELVQLAGGESLFGETGKHSPYLEWEQIRAADPDILLILPCGFDLQRALEDIPFLHSKPGWQDLKAFRNNQIYVLDGNQYFNRPGPRLVDSLEILAEIFHPELFPARLIKTAALQLRLRSSRELQEGMHYRMTPEGLLEFSRNYHLLRGYCCGSGCKNCPY